MQRLWVGGNFATGRKEQQTQVTNNSHHDPLSRRNSRLEWTLFLSVFKENLMLSTVSIGFQYSIPN